MGNFQSTDFPSMTDVETECQRAFAMGIGTFVLRYIAAEPQKEAYDWQTFTNDMYDFLVEMENNSTCNPSDISRLWQMASVVRERDNQTLQPELNGVPPRPWMHIRLRSDTSWVSMKRRR